jgi:hypothetical protein
MTVPNPQPERLPLFPPVRSLVAIGAVVFVLACVAFALARAEPHPSFPKSDAARAALADSGVRQRLAGSGWNAARVLPLDRTHWRVTFFAGPRQVLDAAVDQRGAVGAVEWHRAGLHPPGSATLWHRALLWLLCFLFVAAVATTPLVSLRNLDALVIGVGFTLSAALLDDRLVAAHVYVGCAALAYVAIRCAQRGFGAEAVAAEQPLLHALPARPLAWVAATVFAAALILVITSTGISDVAFAGLAGGTLLNHGVSPYGHITTEVVHGDTYPLLTYVLYMPFAAVAPVRDSFDSLDGGLWLNALALAAAAALLLRRFGGRTMVAWLAFPPVLLAASGGGNDVPAAAFVVAALVSYGRDQLAAGMLAMAGWVKIAPAAALIPLLARLRGTSLTRCLAIVAVLLAAGLLAMLAIGGTGAVDQATTALRFQFERGSWFSFWRQLDAPALQVALQGLTVAFAVCAGVFAARNPDISLGRYAALSGALLALIQLSANYWTYAYLPWVLPFILVALFPPARPRSPQHAPPAP